MEIRYRLSLATALTCVFALAACSGGGSSSGSGIVPSTPSPTGTATPISGISPRPGATATPKPTPSPTGVAYTLPSSGTATLSNFVVQSQPAGLAFTLNGANQGVTPKTLTPAFSAADYTFTFLPTNGQASYSASVSQNGSIGVGITKNIVYNQVIDTFGAITAGTSTLSITERRAERLVQSSAFNSISRPKSSTSRIEVTYDTNALGNQTFAALESRFGLSHAITLSQNGSFVTRAMKIKNGMPIAQTIDSLQGTAGVVSARALGLRYPLAASSCSKDNPCYANDPYFEASNDGKDGDQWNLWTIDAEDAWGYVANNSTAPIAIIDTGFDVQQQQILPLVTHYARVYNGEIYHDSGSVQDVNGHGTFISTIADALTNDGNSFAGLAFNAPLLEYNATDNATNPAMDTADEAAAIRDAVANNAKVILLAFGGANEGAGPDPAESDAVAYALSQGVSVVAASGNEGHNGEALDYPAAYPGVISVGASVINDSALPGVVTGCSSATACNSEAVAAYSNAGTGLGLVAPGGQGAMGDQDLLHWVQGLTTTTPQTTAMTCSTPQTPSTCRIEMTGTSIAAAEVAATVSMMLSVQPNASPAQIAQMLYAGADDIKDANQGHGRLNAQRAVAIAAGDAVNANPSFPIPRNINFVAFGYTNHGVVNAAPQIIDSTYPRGVSVAIDGTFRIADILPANIPSAGYKIATWYDANGNGIVDAGDYFAATSTCTSTAHCTAAASMHPNLITTASFALP